MARFSGKVALVTGSSNGIGRATALIFAQEGAKVTITGRNAERLEETRKEILAAGIAESDVLAVVADLATEAGQDDLIGSTLKKFGRLDILVNNAGAAFNDAQGQTGVSQDVSVYDKIMQINLRSVVTLTQKAKPFLIEAKGEVINVSSIAAGPQAQPTFMYYAMSKASLDQFTRSAAIELIQHGVRVNSVSPAPYELGLELRWARLMLCWISTRASWRATRSAFRADQWDSRWTLLT
ncbi:unnamed protein product [Caenorhabditis sp. 36 PRJEB53466]|nr:unnamed protein product [Caenorhabditis sp. 36 PRJEB53466]